MNQDYVLGSSSCRGFSEQTDELRTNFRNLWLTHKKESMGYSLVIINVCIYMMSIVYVQ